MDLKDKEKNKAIESIKVDRKQTQKEKNLLKEEEKKSEKQLAQEKKEAAFKAEVDKSCRKVWIRNTAMSLIDWSDGIAPELEAVGNVPVSIGNHADVINTPEIKAIIKKSINGEDLSDDEIVMRDTLEESELIKEIILEAKFLKCEYKFSEWDDEEKLFIVKQTESDDKELRKRAKEVRANRSKMMKSTAVSLEKNQGKLNALELKMITLLPLDKQEQILKKRGLSLQDKDEEYKRLSDINARKYEKMSEEEKEKFEIDIFMRTYVGEEDYLKYPIKLKKSEKREIYNANMTEISKYSSGIKAWYMAKKETEMEIKDISEKKTLERSKNLYDLYKRFTEQEKEKKEDQEKKPKSFFEKNTETGEAYRMDRYDSHVMAYLDRIDELGMDRNSLMKAHDALFRLEELNLNYRETAGREIPKDPQNIMVYHENLGQQDMELRALADESRKTIGTLYRIMGKSVGFCKEVVNIRKELEDSNELPRLAKENQKRVNAILCSKDRNDETNENLSAEEKESEEKKDTDKKEEKKPEEEKLTEQEEKEKQAQEGEKKPEEKKPEEKKDADKQEEKKPEEEKDAEQEENEKQKEELKKAKEKLVRDFKRQAKKAEKQKKYEEEEKKKLKEKEKIEKEKKEKEEKAAKEKKEKEEKERKEREEKERIEKENKEKKETEEREKREREEKERIEKERIEREKKEKEIREKEKNRKEIRVDIDEEYYLHNGYSYISYNEGLFDEKKLKSKEFKKYLVEDKQNKNKKKKRKYYDNGAMQKGKLDRAEFVRQMDNIECVENVLSVYIDTLKSNKLIHCLIKHITDSNDVSNDAEANEYILKRLNYQIEHNVKYGVDSAEGLLDFTEEDMSKVLEGLKAAERRRVTTDEAKQTEKIIGGIDNKMDLLFAKRTIAGIGQMTPFRKKRLIAIIDEKTEKLVDEEQPFIYLPDVEQKEFQGNAECWADTTSNLIRYTGNDVNIREIKGYMGRKGNLSAQQFFIENRDKYNDISDYVDYILNKAKGYSLEERGITCTTLDDGGLTIAEQVLVFKESVVNALRENTPIGIGFSKHYQTVVGIDGDDLILKNPLSNSANNLNQLTKKSIKDIVGKSAVQHKKAPKKSTGDNVPGLVKLFRLKPIEYTDRKQTTVKLSGNGHLEYSQKGNKSVVRDNYELNEHQENSVAFIDPIRSVTTYYPRVKPK